MSNFKHMLLPALLGLAALSSPAQAEVRSWNYGYQGFTLNITVPPWQEPPPAPVFRGDLFIFGNFVADDRDNDGVIVHDELISLTTLNNDFLACESNTDNPYARCGVGRDFRFNIADNSLTVSAGWDSHDEATARGFGFSNYSGYYNYFAFPGGSDAQNWIPTAQTRSWVVASVPEPESYAMMGAGLLALAWVVRRRKTA